MEVMSDRKADLSPSACPELTPQVYADWRASDLGTITERLERELMLERIGDVSGKSVLEVGCGDGELAVLLAGRGARVSAIDISESMIETARERAKKSHINVDFRVASAQDIPHGDQQFDMVIAVTILCFVKDASPVFREIARVLRPHGRLVIGELGKWSTWAMDRRIRSWFGSRLWSRGVFRTPTGLRHLALAAGLRPLAVRGAIYYPRFTWAARLMVPYDRQLSRLTNVGAAFLTLEATKPEMAWSGIDAKNGVT